MNRILISIAMILTFSARAYANRMTCTNLTVASGKSAPVLIPNSFVRVASGQAKISVGEMTYSGPALLMDYLFTTNGPDLTATANVAMLLNKLGVAATTRNISATTLQVLVDNLMGTYLGYVYTTQVGEKTYHFIEFPGALLGLCEQ